MILEYCGRKDDTRKQLFPDFFSSPVFYKIIWLNVIDLFLIGMYVVKIRKFAEQRNFKILGKKGALFFPASGVIGET